MAVTELPPWTKVVRPHRDIEQGELDISAYAADLGGVDRQDPNVPAVYRDAGEFFRTTYLTRNLRRLLTDVMGVIAGAEGDRVIQLRTPFGGGKTHSLLALLHLMRSRSEIDPGLLEGIADPGAGKTVVLSGVDLDPFSGREVDGLHIRTLWGELAYRLGGRDRYELVREHDVEGGAPGGDTLRQVIGDQPTLILLDEVLVYVESAGGDTGTNPRRGQALVFLQKLTEVVRNLPHAAMVYSLQASTHEAAGDEALLTELEKLVTRIDAKREPVADDELTRVVQRRLFPDFGSSPEHEVVAAQVAREYATAYRHVREAYGQTTADRRAAGAEAEKFEARVRESYPFHPALLDLMYHRWGSLPSYQRTRGALQFLARVVHALWEGTDRPAQALIGPGDAPLGDELVRGAFFSQVGQPREQYMSVLSADVVGAEARARGVDERMATNAPRFKSLRLGTRTATAIMLYSFGARETEEPGVVESDLVEALATPEIDRNVLAATLSDLREQLLYLHDSGRRYRFEPKANLNHLISDAEKIVSSDEVLARVRHELDGLLAGAGDGALVWPAESGEVPDHQAQFRIVYLDPEVASLDDDALVDHVRTLLEQAGSRRRDFKNALAFAVPRSFPASGTTARDSAADRCRQGARKLLALDAVWDGVRTERHKVQEHQRLELEERRRAQGAELRAATDNLYQAVLVPLPDREGQGPVRFEPVDLRAQLTAGRGLHERLLDALRKYVFETLTPTRLATLTKLGDERAAVACEDLPAWFFSYLDFPKLASADVLRRTIAQGTADTFGYVPAAHLDDGEVVTDRPDLVRFGSPTSELEIDLGDGCFLLSVGEVERLRGPESVGPEPETTTSTVSDTGLDRSSASATEETTESGDALHRFHLRANLDPAQFFRILPAIQNLADQATTLAITVELDAESTDGFDPAWLRNAVTEHLDEAGVKPNRP